MEFITYNKVLEHLPQALNDDYVQEALMIIGWESYVMDIGSTPKPSGWYPLLSNHDTDRIAKIIHAYHGTHLSRMILAYCVLKVVTPLEQWRIQTSGLSAILRHGNRVVRDSVLINGKKEPYAHEHWKDICDVFQVMKVNQLEYRRVLNNGGASFRLSYIPPIAYREEAMFGSLPQVTKGNERVISAMLEKDSDIVDLESYMDVKDQGSRWIMYSALLHRIFPLIDDILESLPPPGCKNREIYSRIFSTPMKGDMSFSFQ